MTALKPSQMAEATVALGHLMRHMPADRVVVGRSGVVVETANPMTFARWAETVGAGDAQVVSSSGITSLAIGECAGIEFRVYLRAAEAVA